jgi:hypothetical protein
MQRIVQILDISAADTEHVPYSVLGQRGRDVVDNPDLTVAAGLGALIVRSHMSPSLRLVLN